MIRRISRIAKKASASSDSIPAPVGGWNARDSLAGMKKTDAVKLINWFPQASDVMLRKGHIQHATGLPAAVESLLVYNGPTSLELFAVSDGEIFDVTTAGAVGAAVVTLLTNSRWQHQNISTSGGSFMYAVNGADSPRLYNGTTWTAITGVSSPAITGVTTSDLIHVNLFKRRLFFIQKDTLSAWYLPVDSVGGAASELDFKSVASKGGHLIAMGTWTIDAGTGVDDLAVWVTSQGEVIVYQGTDPDNASTWQLVGIWQVGSPIGRRCLIKYGGDLLLVCVDGVVPLAQYLQSSRTDQRAAITDKIQSAVTTVAALHKATFGWDLLFYPQGNMLFLNVPVSGGQEQYVMNTITKAWCQFQGWDASCWALFNDEPYFGGSTVVGKVWGVFSDNDSDINGDAKQAFNYFGSRGREKRWTMMRPILLTNGSPAVLGGVDVDFTDSESLGVLSSTPSSFAAWDTAVWDTAVWGGGLTVSKEWQGIAGVGFCAAPKLQAASNGIELRWVSTDFVYERGGVL